MAADLGFVDQVHHTRIDICVERQCEPCARMLLEAGCPLTVLTMANFRDVERCARRKAAAAASGRMDCEADTNTQQHDSGRAPRGNVFRRGRALIRVPGWGIPGTPPELINPRERPCVLCGADERGGRRDPHADSCPCVNFESVPEWA